MAEKKTFTGGCRCGHIRYTLALALPADSAPKATRCNCSFCQKLGVTNLKASPDDFTLVAPATYEECGDYRRGSGPSDVHKYFCDKCGVHILGKGQYEFQGKMHDHFSVNLASLDQPQDGLDLSEWKLEYCDGLHDNWMAGLKDKPWSGGLI